MCSWFYVSCVALFHDHNILVVTVTRSQTQNWGCMSNRICFMMKLSHKFWHRAVRPSTKNCRLLQLILTVCTHMYVTPTLSYTNNFPNTPKRTRI